MEIKILKPSAIIRNYLLNELVHYDNENGLSPEFILECQDKIKERILYIKINDYDLYENMISCLYLEYLRYKEIEKNSSKIHSESNILDSDITLDYLLELLEIDNSLLDVLIQKLIVMYGITKSNIKVKFNNELEKKWNPFYKLEMITDQYENSEYEAFKSIIYANFNKKGPSYTIREIKEAKEVFPEFYSKFIIEVLKNFFIYNFVSCEYNELLIKLKEAILRKDNLVEFFENLDFISEVTILIVYLNFSYNYNQRNMDIRNEFAKEESYAKPFIRALSL